MALALWSSTLGDIPSNFLPNDTAARIGSSQGAVKESGNIFSLSAVALTPAVINGNRVVSFFPIPAGAFDVTGRALVVSASGGSAAGGANTRSAVMVVTPTLPVVGSVVPAGTTIAQTGTYTTASVGWTMGCQITKYGAPGSNTQMAVHYAGQVGTAVASLILPQALTLVEANVNYVAVAINNVTSLTDSFLSLLQAEWYN